MITRPASSLAQDRESSHVKDQRSVTVLRRQLLALRENRSALTEGRNPLIYPVENRSKTQLTTFPGADFSGFINHQVLQALHVEIEAADD